MTGRPFGLLPTTSDDLLAEEFLRLAAQDQGQEQAAATAPTIEAEDDLERFLLECFNVRLPKKAVCQHHAAPWRAFCDAYFARSRVSVWKASRGFGGKTFMLALLGLTEALTLKADVNILGGSGEQSRRVHEAMARLWSAPGAPLELLQSEPGKRETRLRFGNVVQALMASQASVRGPHPQRLRLDEVDEMDLSILDASMGQTMSTLGVPAQTVISSTHQNPDGTMSEVLKRAAAKDWPVFEWCFEETQQPHGWLLRSEIAAKRSEVTESMWQTEYELQEPSPEGRAINTEAVATMFQEALGRFRGADGEYVEIEAPVTADDLKPRQHGPRRAAGRYSHGADWAKERDWTVITTLRIDVTPMRVVAWQRVQRRPWPAMVALLDQRITRFGGAACHDGTGIGSVVDDLLTRRVEKVIMVGRARADLLTEYVSFIERQEVVAPFIEFMEREHRYARNQDLYVAGGHPPDSIVSGALAYRASKQRGVRVW